MSEPVERVTRDGREIIVYDDGMERDASTGRIVKASPDRYLNREKALQLHAQRREKMAEALRERIGQITTDRLGAVAKGPVEAFAMAAGMLWEEVVLNPDAYPRDRMQAWAALANAAGMVADRSAPNGSDQSSASLLEQLGEEAARAFLDAARARRERAGSSGPGPDVIDADATDPD